MSGRYAAPAHRADEPVRTFSTSGGRWGGHVTWLNGGRAKPVGLDDGTVGDGPRRVYGHMRQRPKVGDLLAAEMRSGRTARFRFSEVEYESDPDDMFFGTVEFEAYDPPRSGSSADTPTPRVPTEGDPR